MTKPLTGTYTWIPVGERLPEEYRAYPVAGRICDCKEFTGLCYFDAAAKEWDCEDEITHWCEPLKHPDELAKQLHL